MKTKLFIAMARHGWRSSNALDGVFAKQKLQRTKLTWYTQPSHKAAIVPLLMLILFAIAIAIIGCKHDKIRVNYTLVYSPIINKSFYSHYFGKTPDFCVCGANVVGENTGFFYTHQTRKEL